MSVNLTVCGALELEKHIAKHKIQKILSCLVAYESIKPTRTFKDVIQSTPPPDESSSPTEVDTKPVANTEVGNSHLDITPKIRIDNNKVEAPIYDYWTRDNNWLIIPIEDLPTVVIDDKGRPEGGYAHAATLELVSKGMDFGVDALKSSKNLLVHCLVGVSRSTAMSIGILLKYGFSIKESFAYVKKVRPQMDPNLSMISLIGVHLGIRKELDKYALDYRDDNFNDILEGYNALLESNLHDTVMLSKIFNKINNLKSTAKPKRRKTQTSR